MKKQLGIVARIEHTLLTTQYWWWLAVIYGFARIPTWFFPFDSDHWIFYYVGSRWFDGLTLYLQVWDHKSPLIFAINGMMAIVLGSNILLHRLFFTAVSLLAVWLMYITLRIVLKVLSVEKKESAARVGTLVFALWANLAQFTNSANTTEHFGIVALLLAVYCYFRWRQHDGLKWLLYSGAGISLLVFLKINFALLVLPLVIDFVLCYRKSLKQFLAYGLVWAAPVLAQALLWYSYFAPRALLNEWWIAMISFNSKYLRAGWAGNLSGQFIFLVILAACGLFFVGCYAYLVRDIRSTKQKSVLLLSSIAGSALLFSVILGTFYSHYYLIVIPYLSILWAVYWRRLVSSKLLTTLAALGLIISMSVSYRQLYNSFYGPAATDFANMEKAANAIAELTDKDDKIFFYGYGATFYQLAKRDSGSRYVSASHLLIDERENFGFGFTDKFIGDMIMNSTSYVIIDPATIDIYNDNSQAMEFINRRYQTVLTVAGYELKKLR